jgi:hypothetical protein
MLLPVLSRAKSKAFGVYCANNGHQITVAAHVYAGDFNDWLPPNEEMATVGWIGWLPLSPCQNTGKPGGSSGRQPQAHVG